MSPSDSSRALFTSIIPAAVSSRSCFIFSMVLAKVLTSPLLVVLLSLVAHLLLVCRGLLRLPGGFSLTRPTGFGHRLAGGGYTALGFAVAQLSRDGLATSGHPLGIATRCPSRFRFLRLVGGVCI